MGKKKPTLWGGYTQVRNATFEVEKGTKYGVFFPKATVPYLKSRDKQYMTDVAKNFKGAVVKQIKD